MTQHTNNNTRQHVASALGLLGCGLYCAPLVTLGILGVAALATAVRYGMSR